MSATLFGGELKYTKRYRLGQTTPAHHEAALQITTRDEFFDQQPGHDRLARSRIISQQEAQRVTR